MSTQYKVVSHWTKEGLTNRVNELLQRGWQVSGNVTVSMTDTYASDGEKETEYLQAMTKETPCA